MNHKYLHAINVWTKELERLSRENFFSHEKQCFKSQCIFNFVSSIANLKSEPASPNPFEASELRSAEGEGRGWMLPPGKRIPADTEKAGG